MPGASTTTASCPRQRHKRARTGCERCRAQHRKCNEEKPRCRRCTDAGATCKYTAHISFLDKNSRTLSNNVSSRPSSASAAPEYPVLEYIISNGSSSQRATSVISPTSTVTSYSSRPEEQRIGLGTVLESQPVILTAASQLPVLEDRSRSFDQKDSHNLGTYESGNPDRLNGPKPPSDSPWGASCEIDSGWPLVGRSTLSDDEISLLKYYGHHVAPWLDVYDQNQTFRHLVTQLAMISPCVLEGILQLSAAFSSRPITIVQRRGVGALHIQAMSRPAETKSPFYAIVLIAGFVLARTFLFVQAIPDTWEHSFHRGIIPPFFSESNFTDAVQRRTWLSFLALISRLEIACSLMNQTAPVMIPRLIHEILIASKTYEAGVNQPQEIFNASLHCLELLADVMNLCLPVSEVEDDAVPPQAEVSTLAGISRADKWRKSLDKLWTWQTNRPSELRQLIEVEGQQAAFPTVIFASGAGISSNTLYHTAMLLLLSSWPQSISLCKWDKKSELDAAQLSPIWHARRVCGIALNSDPEHTKCWDPCMIAAFWLAARRMTHPSQQNDIIVCLGRVKVAGWHIDGLAQRLRDEWGPIC